MCVLVCRGTSSGIAQIDGAYTMYKKTYTDCTYVDGNLELVFLINQHNYNLSFLKVPHLIHHVSDIITCTNFQGEILLKEGVKFSIFPLSCL